MYSETLSCHVLSTQGKTPMLFSQRGKRLFLRCGKNSDDAGPRDPLNASKDDASAFGEKRFQMFKLSLGNPFKTVTCKDT